MSRAALMGQLHAVAAQAGIDHQGLRDLFRVESLTLVSDADIGAWIKRHNRPHPQSCETGGAGFQPVERVPPAKRRRPSAPGVIRPGSDRQRRKLRALMFDLVAHGYSQPQCDAVLAHHGCLDIAGPHSTRVLSAAITQLERLLLRISKRGAPAEAQ